MGLTSLYGSICWSAIEQILLLKEECANYKSMEIFTSYRPKSAKDTLQKFSKLSAPLTKPSVSR